jgi:Phage integrase, N-terminal SAM-like domain
MDNTKNQQKSTLPTPVSQGLLTRKEFQALADVPPELEWFANIDNARTRRAYQIDLKDFMHFVGILNPSDFRLVTRAHLIAWRKDLEQRQLGGATIRRKLAAPSSLFEYLCERNKEEKDEELDYLDIEWADIFDEPIAWRKQLEAKNRHFINLAARYVAGHAG